MRRIAGLVAVGLLALAPVGCGGDDDRAATSDASSATSPSTRPPTTAPARPASIRPSTTTSSTTTSSTTTAPTTTVAPALPTPIAPPPEDGSTEPTFEVATIEIPRLGLRSAVYEGIRLSTLDRGPGHWPGTALPGEPGNVVVAGHRVSHNAAFRHLDDLVPGDEVIMATLGGRFVYRVVRTEVVGPDALWIVEQTPARTATLFACHPPGSVRERIVAHLELAA